MHERRIRTPLRTLLLHSAHSKVHRYIKHCSLILWIVNDVDSNLNKFLKYHKFLLSKFEVKILII